MALIPKQNDALGTTNRGNPCESGLCTLCTADCKGKCETWLSSLLGRKLLYPRDFANITAGSANVSAVGIGYHALRIQGYAHGAQGLDEVQLPGIERAEILIAREHVPQLAGHRLAFPREQHPQVLNGWTGSAVIKVDEVRTFVGPEYISGVAVTVQSNLADLPG